MGGAQSLPRVGESANLDLPWVGVVRSGGKAEGHSDAPKPVGGELAVPAAPGWGVTLDREVMRDTLVTAET